MFAVACRVVFSGQMPIVVQLYNGNLAALSREKQSMTELNVVASRSRTQ